MTRLQPALRTMTRGVHASPQATAMGTLQVPGDSAQRTVSVFPGHGIGPELTNAAMKVVEASGAPVDFEIVDNITDAVTPEAIASLAKNRVALKGEFGVEAGPGTKPSINMELRKGLDLYANVVHSFPLPGTKPRHEGIDIVVVRESTEGEYSGMEHEVAPGITESLKIITREASLRIARYAFEFAYLNNRAKVTAVHKANIMKQADGMFIQCCKEVSEEYPQIEYEEVIVDNCMMQLMSRPQQFDVMVTPNFYGSLVANCVAGLTGGPGLVPGATIGEGGAIFEQGARHTAFDIAGQDKANPTGMLLASANMLRHLRLPVFADRVEEAVFSCLEEGTKTADIGGGASMTSYVDAVAAKVAASANSGK